ncbi:hypothetical protein [Lichenifustis flavocetrariae]|uniref:Uncharacterized protein n=1 Tax=Lichenifustis flavocetrariae TaxID=2949735 RepID=A0AA42CS08_9HYPH|nr:hypothetical protein [Lichenifustis flavocetrariae]MCW6513010.1 hypothetical protein [Lichenifustis flavocetrariae]
MLLSHRILREAHKQRLIRRKKLVTRANFSPVETMILFFELIRVAESNEFFDLVKLNLFEERLSDAIMDAVVGSGVLEDLSAQLNDLVLTGKDYKNRLDRQMAVGAAAMAVSLLEERILSSAVEVLRRLAAIKHEEDPSLKLADMPRAPSSVSRMDTATAAQDGPGEPSEASGVDDSAQAPLPASVAVGEPLSVVLQLGLPRNGRTGELAGKSLLPHPATARLTRAAKRATAKIAEADRLFEEAEAAKAPKALADAEAERLSASG